MKREKGKKNVRHNDTLSSTIFCQSVVSCVYCVTNPRDTEHSVLHFTVSIAFSQVQKDGPKNNRLQFVLLCYFQTGI